MFDCAIIGGGIVGLATAMTLGRERPRLRIVVVEKESGLAAHQTGRNSGVIHSGIYYKPGSMKARFARAGSQSMVDFCREHGIRHEVCGKVIVATEREELPRLEQIFRRGLENGLAVAQLSADELRAVEPHVRGLAGVRVPTTGIVSYREVCEKYAGLVRAQGGEIRLGTRVLALRDDQGQHRIETDHGAIEARFLVNCAGLQSDRVVQMAGLERTARIVPFRGEYYELVPEKRYLVKHLIYPVPNPAFPFLGVHFTRMVDGTIHAGPNAVLAFKREGYHKSDFSLRDSWDSLTYPGFWHLAGEHLADGWMEMRRSFSKSLFVQSLQRLIPEVQEADVIPTHAGVRAQALLPDGRMVDDFLLIPGTNAIHVCNAPSPAATASLEIAREIVGRLPDLQVPARA